MFDQIAPSDSAEVDARCQPAGRMDDLIAASTWFRHPISPDLLAYCRTLPKVDIRLAPELGRPPLVAIHGGSHVKCVSFADDVQTTVAPHTHGAFCFSA